MNPEAMSGVLIVLKLIGGFTIPRYMVLLPEFFSLEALDEVFEVPEQADKRNIKTITNRFTVLFRMFIMTPRDIFLKLIILNFLDPLRHVIRRP